MSVARKLLLPPQAAPCRTCGRRIGVSPLTTWMVLLQTFAAIVIAEHAFPTGRAARAVFVAVLCLVINTLWQTYAPLVRREAGSRRT
jgi:hypothetical protein